VATTEAPDTAAFFGSLPAAGLSGNMVFTEPSDGVMFDVSVTGSFGTLATTEAADTAGFLAYIGTVSGILAATENQDLASFVVHLEALPVIPPEKEVLKFGQGTAVLDKW
jgi:hypothetical protein